MMSYDKLQKKKERQMAIFIGCYCIFTFGMIALLTYFLGGR